MLTPGNNALALRIAETLKNRCTHETLRGVAEDVGFALGDATTLPPYLPCRNLA